jgi:hypothetical protein
MSGFWDVAPSSLVELDRRFRSAYPAASIIWAVVYFNTTRRRYIPEGCLLHTRHRENLKLHADCLQFNAEF